MGALVRRRGLLQGPLEVAAGRLGRTTGPGVLRRRRAGRRPPSPRRAAWTRSGGPRPAPGRLRPRGRAAAARRCRVPRSASGMAAADGGPDQWVREGRRVAGLHARRPGPARRRPWRPPRWRARRGRRRGAAAHPARARRLPPRPPARRLPAPARRRLVERCSETDEVSWSCWAASSSVAPPLPATASSSSLISSGLPPVTRAHSAQNVSVASGNRRRTSSAHAVRRQRAERQCAAAHLSQQAGEQVLDGGGLTGPHVRPAAPPAGRPGAGRGRAGRSPRTGRPTARRR